MNAILITVFSILLWIISLVQGSGLGNSINITSKFHVLLFIILLPIILVIIRKDKLYIKRNYLYILFILFLSFIVIPLLSKNTDGIGYLSAFLVCYLFSLVPLKHKNIKLIALFNGILGILFLYIYNYTSILSGWNENSIAMIGFFSYAIFYIGFMDDRKKYRRIFTLVIVILYLYLLNITDSRSSSLFVALSILFIFNIIRPQNFYETGKYVYLLFIPLLVVIIALIISNTSYYERLNLWSIKQFEKPIFNGRDALWESGIDQLKHHLLFGTKKIGNGWHNSAITCLTAYGIIGYTAWIALFKSIIDRAKHYFNDSYVCAALTAFLFIYLQQSVELGLIATQPNLIPYVALGIMLGRVRYLKEKNEHGNKL